MRHHLHKLAAHVRTLPAKRELLFALAFVVVALVLLSMTSSTQKLFVSSELQFTDTSVRGLAIVPASCPSTPHGSEVCDVAASNNCSISAGSSTLSPGQSTTLQWAVTQPSYLAGLFPSSFSGNISPGVGTVSGWSGSNLASPPVTTTYVLNGTLSVSIPWFGSIRTGSTQCQTTVTVQSPCPVGYVLQDGACVFDMCPRGYEQQGEQCVYTAPACSTLNYCVGTTLWHRDAECSTNPIQACSLGCTAGACIGNAAPGVILWQVRPPLVASGNTANVSWQATSVRSCEVSGNNGDSWSGTTGAQVTSPITAQTIYTLSCIGLDDSIVTRTGTVNILPVFCESGAPGCSSSN